MNDSLDPILQQEEQRRLRTQLIWRLGIAVALVAGVLGVLSWLEQDKDAPPKMTVTQPRDVRIAPRASTAASSPVASTPAASAPAASTPQATHPPIENVNQASAPVTANAQITSTQPLSPVSGQTPAPFKAPRTSPPNSPSHPSVPRPASPEETAKPPLAARPEKQVNTVAQPQPEKQAPRAGEPAVRYPAPISTPNGYTVQAGVFLHATNAEKLLRQLQTVGVPAYLETRVQIGPFSNKAEAEAAIRKLRQAGITPVLKK